MRTSSMMDRRRGCLPPRRCRGDTPAGRHGAGKRPQKLLKSTRQAPKGGRMAPAAHQPTPPTPRPRRPPRRSWRRGGLERRWRTTGQNGGRLAVREGVGVRARASRPLCHSATLPSPRAPRAVPMEVDEPAPEQEPVLTVSRGPGDKGGALQPEPPLFYLYYRQRVAPKLPLPSSRCPARREERREAPAPAAAVGSSSWGEVGGGGGGERGQRTVATNPRRNQARATIRLPRAWAPWLGSSGSARGARRSTGTLEQCSPGAATMREHRSKRSS